MAGRGNRLVGGKGHEVGELVRGGARVGQMAPREGQGVLQGQLQLVEQARDAGGAQGWPPRRSRGSENGGRTAEHA